MLLAAPSLDVLIANLPDEVKLQAQIIGGFVALLWILELFDSILLGGVLNYFGIRPRQPEGLLGIALAPLLHGNLGHLLANTGPLLILGWLVMLRETRDFFIVTLVVWLLAGAGTWLFGRSNTNHVGASSLIFGYFGFLLARGFFEKSPGAVAIAALVGILYGGMIWGILPLHRGRSWTGHFFGMISGVLAARYLPVLQQWWTV